VSKFETRSFFCCPFRYNRRMATVTFEPLTLEQYAAQADRAFSELVQGRVVPVNPPTPRHGQICVRVVLLVGAHVQSRDLGHLVANDAGVITARDPDSVRGADVAYYSYQQVPRGPLPTGYLKVSPDLLFEILSPNDRRAALLTKVGEYLAAGLRAVCVLDDSTRTIEVFRPEGPTELFAAEDEFAVSDVLSEFRVAVLAFFE